MFVTFRDARTGLAYLRSCRDLRERGLWLALDAYQGHVFWEFREVADGVPASGAGSPSGSAGVGCRRSTRRSSRAPAGAGPRAAPALFDDGHVAAVLDGTATGRRSRRARGAPGGPAGGGGGGDRRVGRPGADRGAHPRRRRRRPRTATAPAGSRAGTGRPCSAGWCCRGSASWPGRRRRGDEPGVVRRAAPRPRSWHPGSGRSASTKGARGAWPTSSGCCSRCRARRPSGVAGGRPTCASSRAGSTRDPIRAAMGVNTWEGVEWLDRDRFADLLAGPSASMPSRPAATRTRRLLGAPRDGERPRRPATGSMRCLSAPQPGRRAGEPAQQRRRRRAVTDDRLEVVAVAEPRGLAEAAGQGARTDRRRIGAGGGRRAPARLELDVPHLHRAREVGRAGSTTGARA